jgi:hypothetical protein
MIKNPEILKKFEEEFLKNKGDLPYRKALALYTAMWIEAVSLGIFPYPLYDYQGSGGITIWGTKTHQGH